MSTKDIDVFIDRGSGALDPELVAIVDGEVYASRICGQSDAEALAKAFEDLSCKVRGETHAKGFGPAKRAS